MNLIKGPLQKVVKKVLKPILPVVMVAVALAMLALGVYIATSLLDWVPGVIVPVIGTVSPLRVVFINAFLIGLVVGGMYLLYRNNRERIHEKWSQYSTWAKSMMLGTVSALFGALILTVAYTIGWIGVSTVVLGVLLTWPLVVGAVLFGYRWNTHASSFGDSLSTAYVLTRGLESRTLSVIIGLLVAIAGGVSVDYVASRYLSTWPLWASVAVGSLLLIVVTFVAYNRYEKATVERTDLTIVELTSLESRTGRELLLKNTSGRTVALAGSFIRDTDLCLYRPDFDYKLKPGQYGTLEIDESFSLEPNDEVRELPLGYDLKQGGETPAIFTKDGEVHYLQWTDEAAGVIERESSKHVTDLSNTTGEQDPPAVQRESLSDSGVDPSPQD